MLSLLATKTAAKEPVKKKEGKKKQLGQPGQPKSWADLYSGKSGRAGNIPLPPNRWYLHVVIIRHY